MPHLGAVQKAEIYRFTRSFGACQFYEFCL